MPNAPVVPVAIVGTGPYGLSIAAQLRARGVSFRIFGEPMQSWLEQMPEGMHLKSVGFASNLSGPDRHHTLASFCAQDGRDYADDAWPIPLDTFAAYGLWFQQQVVPAVERVEVVGLDGTDHGFELTLSSRERVAARRVVLATGHTHFAYVPTSLSGLPEELVSHSSRHRDFTHFAGRDVTVIGAGQSALESAALLHESGANVRVLARAARFEWNSDPIQRRWSLWQRLTRPPSGLGAGWKTWLYSNRPSLFSRLPYPTRAKIVQTALGPAGAWWLKPRVIGQLPLETRHEVRMAEPAGSGVRLMVESPSGRRELPTEHVLAATGYRVDLDRLSFLADRLVTRVRLAGGAPVLSGGFESSVPGLYFTGLSAAPTFGPVMRFVYGTEFAANRVADHVALAEGRGALSRPDMAQSRSG